MKTCIWCKKTEDSVPFDKIAHIVPQALGGDHICENVCDVCNEYFGSQQNGDPSIDLVFKETFNITRARLLGNKEIGKNKILHHFKSVYFKLDLKKGKVDVKPSFKLRRGFQHALIRQFKKGLYKSFLEEIERVNNDGLNSKYDFIREFARYNLGDYPVFYFPRSMPMLLLRQDDTRHPQFSLDKMFNYMINDSVFFEVEFLGHLFGFPITRYYQTSLETYLNDSITKKGKYHRLPVELIYLTQIDLILSVMNV